MVRMTGGASNFSYQKDLFSEYMVLADKINGTA
jgi:hypothetical protein